MTLVYVALSFLYVLNMIALVLAWSAQRQSPRRLVSMVADLDAELGQLVEQQASLAASFKKLNAKVAAKHRRDQNGAANPAPTSTAQMPGESDQDWKKRMRIAIATRKLVHDHNQTEPTTEGE